MEATFQTNYTYDNDNRERTAVTFGHTRTTHYDAFGRVTERNWNEGTSSQYKSICYYPGNGNNRSLLPNKVMAFRSIVSGTEYLKLASEGKIIEKPEDISKISDKAYPCPRYFSYLLCFWPVML